MSEKPSASLKTSSRIILLIALVIAMGILIARNIGVTKNILLVMLGFGAVVLVHEFGHFVVAKLCGIKVEAFSIGFPPILLGIKKVSRGWRIRIVPELLREDEQSSEDGPLSFTVGQKELPGETEYRIGLIPFGGFVKMLGQEDVGPVKTNSDPRSFANKPALARAAVLAAGVVFNVISAAIVYMVVFLVGINLMGPVVGGVIPGSPAERAGIRPGDEVIEIAGESGHLDYSDVMMAAVLSGKEKAVAMKVRHEDGAIENVSVVAEMQPDGQFRDFGIRRPSGLTVAKVFADDVNLLFANTGLLSGDRIKAVAGVDVNSHWQFEQIIKQTFEPNVAIVAERRQPSGETQMVEGRLALGFAPQTRAGAESEANLANICGLVPRLRITAVSSEQMSLRERLSRAFKKGDDVPRLKPADIIVAVADVNNPTYSDMRRLTTANEGKTMPVTVLRSEPNGPMQCLTVPVVPRKSPDSNRVVIGLALDFDVEHPVATKAFAAGQNQRPIAIPAGATITSVDGAGVSNFFDIVRQLKQSEGKRVRIDWRLDERTTGNVAIDTAGISQSGMIGVDVFLGQPVPFADLERLYKADGPVEAMRMGYKRTKTFIIQTYVTLQRLIGGLVSPKQLMGPVGILTFSYRIVAAQPFIYYVYFLGLISASIAVLNFMPLPPLDGGLTLLLLIEKIKGSAISVRTQEIIAYMGWGLVGALLLYVTFNDIVRSVLGG